MGGGGRCRTTGGRRRMTNGGFWEKDRFQMEKRVKKKKTRGLVCESWMNNRLFSSLTLSLSLSKEKSIGVVVVLCLA